MSKKLLLPLITFLAILVTGVTGLVGAIEQHETWRIIVCGSATVLIIVAAIVWGIGNYRQRNRQA